MSGQARIPSILKKLLMALTGLLLAGFVFVHMLGNLNMFIGQDAMNEYAHFLQTLPKGLLWGFRIGLIFIVLLHVWMAILLSKENKAARPESYDSMEKLDTNINSRTMGFTGAFLAFFIVFHIAHFTLRIVFPEYQDYDFYVLMDGEPVYNVYKMVIAGFSKIYVSIFYIVAMAFLCMHLSHGVSSLFQTFGLKTSKWRCCFDKASKVYGWVIFLGFISTPVAVLLSKYFNLPIF